MKGLIGKKLGMTQVYGDQDQLIPVTVIEAGPCVVTQIKTDETDGYTAVQLGFGACDEKKLNRPANGHLKKAKVAPHRYLAEMRVNDPGEYKVGQELKADTFTEGDRADVVSVSKGKGFAGGMKRWGFSGGPGGHGSHFHRRTGSAGAAATPSRVIKGKKGPGQMGSVKSAISNLNIVKVDPEQNIIMLGGSVPGARGAMVLIRETKKVQSRK